MTPAELRAKRILTAGEKAPFDVVVIGGGIHGAQLTLQLTLRGYRVLLLEAQDFAAGTSSRSSKMLHGGIRYLETHDFGLVRESLIERASYVHQLGHLTRPQEFCFPVLPGVTRPAWMVRAGMFLYDALDWRLFSPSGSASSHFHSHRQIRRGDPEWQQLAEFGLRFEALFAYWDGQMDDARIVIELIADATARGATTLNYCEVEQIRYDRTSAHWSITWRDRTTDCRSESAGLFLINAAGPWITDLDQRLGEAWKPDWPSPVFSRGSHLLFDVKWPLPGLTIPTGKGSRYYFVWPFFSAAGEQTLVGPTDVAVPNADRNPRVSKDEIEELFGFLRRDLPRSPLTRERLYTDYAGLRVLAASAGANAATSELSRRESWLKRDAYLALLGGKYTGARVTAEDGCNLVDSHFRRTRSSQELDQIRSVQIQGGVNWSAKLGERLAKSICEKYFESTVSENTSRAVRSLVNRFGSNAERVVAQSTDALEIVGHSPAVLRAEIRWAIAHEQAVTAEDITRRRLGLDLLPGDDRTGLALAVQQELSAAGISGPKPSATAK